MIVEFPNSELSTVLRLLPTLGDFDYKPCSYAEYKNPIPQEIKQYKDISEIEEDSLPEALATSMNQDVSGMDETREQASGGDDNTWTSVVHSKPGLLTRVKKRRETPCRWGEHCSKAARCLNKHTEYEIKLFRGHPRFNFRDFKVNECTEKYSHTTPELRKACLFAHTKEDSWCPNCLSYGHLKQDCKVKKQS